MIKTQIESFWANLGLRVAQKWVKEASQRLGWLYKVAQRPKLGGYTVKKV